MRRTLALLAFLLAALFAVPVAAAPPPKTVPPKYTVAQRNYADAPPTGDAVQTTGTVEDDSGDQVAGLSVQKVSCKNSSAVTGNGYEVREGACGLRYSDGLTRGKFRVTLYRYSTGEAVAGNVGWDASPPHYRRTYWLVAGPANGINSGTQQRGACLGCHSTVGYSLRDCDYPVNANYYADTAELNIRVGGVLYGPFNWVSDTWGSGCGWP